MSNEARRTYVIDSSVLLADTRAFYRFKEHRVVVPLFVIPQLRSKLHDPEVSGRAFAALAQLDSLREENGRLDDDIPLNDIGGTLKVEINHVSSGKLPPGFQTDDMSRILLVAHNLKAEDEKVNVILVSKDLATRLMASSLGIRVEDYRQVQADTVWTGIETVHVFVETLAAVEEGRCRITPSDEVPVNTGFNMVIPDGTAVLTRLGSDGLVRRVESLPLANKLKARNPEQMLAFDLLRDTEIGVVSLGGRAGTGKTVMAVLAGLHAIQHDQAKKIIVIRPIDPVGRADLGYLPGTQAEKMEPWSQAIYDSVANIDQIKGAIMTSMEIIPVTHARGRTYYDSFVIVDEAQSFERVVLLGLIERIGQGSRIVFTHDIDQRDNPRVGRHDGIAAIIEEYRGNPLFGHVELVDAVRSPIAASAASLLRDDQPQKHLFLGDFDKHEGGFESLMEH